MPVNAGTNNQEIHVGDVDTTIRVAFEDDGSATDISSATTKNVILKAPSGVLKTFAGSYATASNGTDGLLEYVTTTDADLDEAGAWLAEGEIAKGSQHWKSSVLAFMVYEILEDTS